MKKHINFINLKVKNVIIIVRAYSTGMQIEST